MNLAKCQSVALHFVVFSLCCFACIARVTSTSLQYEHSVFLDDNNRYELRWVVSEVNKTIHFAAVVNTTGWVGFGISKGLTGKMEGADVVIGYVRSDGETYFEDSHAVGNFIPMKDNVQNYYLEGISAADNQVTMRFSRLIQNCDETEDNPIVDGTVKLIYAYNDSYPQAGDNRAFQYHGSTRGSKSLRLLNIVDSQPPPSSTSKLQLETRNAQLPPDETVYWCTGFSVFNTSFGGKQHVINISPIIQPGNEGIVQQIELHQCPVSSLTTLHDISENCYGAGATKFTVICREPALLFVWAAGGSNFEFPANVGLPIGVDAEERYLIKVRYDNPLKRSDIVDNSGLALHYESTLRANEAGVLVTGIRPVPSLFIPPGQNVWTDVGYCFPDCLKIPTLNVPVSQQNIKIFASYARQNLAGTGLSTRILASGNETAEITRDDNFDYFHQQMRRLPMEHTLDKGDYLVTTCNFNTNASVNVTVGGLLRNDAMCYNYLMYYPKQNVVECMTSDRKVVDTLETNLNLNCTNHICDWKDTVWNATVIDEVKVALNQTETWGYCVDVVDKVLVAYQGSLKNKPVIDNRLPPDVDTCASATAAPPSGAIHIHSMLAHWLCLVGLVLVATVQVL